MNAHINIRCTLYPLPRMRNGYFCSRSAVGSETHVDDVSLHGGNGVEPLSHARSGNLNNQEGNDLDNRKPFLETYSDRGCPATGHPCPKKLKEGEE